MANETKRKVTSVGELRRIMAALADDARILPDWQGYDPGDAEPGVALEGFRVMSDEGGEYLSVGVSLFYLNEEWEELLSVVSDFLEDFGGDYAGPTIDRARKALGRRGDEICAECGESVAPGSGLFVNRVPICDTAEERAAMGYPFPAGAYLCAPCDLSIRGPAE